jgi:hypothetical protein
VHENRPDKDPILEFSLVFGLLNGKIRLVRQTSLQHRLDMYGLVADIQ